MKLIQKTYQQNSVFSGISRWATGKGYALADGPICDDLVLKTMALKMNAIIEDGKFNKKLLLAKGGPDTL